MKAQKIKRVIAEICALKTVNTASWNRLQPLISRDKRAGKVMSSIVPALDLKLGRKFPKAAPIYFGIVDAIGGKALHVGACVSLDPESDDGWPNEYWGLEWPANVDPRVSAGSSTYWLFDYLIPLVIVSLAVKGWCGKNRVSVPVFVGFDAGDVFRIHN